MIQFNSTICTIASRFTTRLLWRMNASLTTNAATITSESINKVKEEASDIILSKEQQAKFDELKTKLCSDLKAESSVAAKIQSAQNVHDLLEVMKKPLFSQRNIREAIGTISIWVNKSNRDKTNNDESFTKNKELYVSINESHKDIENISQYHDLSTSQMIKEINKLSQTRNRNVQLLNFFFQNIIEYNEALNAGACSNLMYSMSTLSYSDERLLKKICTDLISIISSPRGISVVTLVSIIKSMAFVRYKNDVFINHVCDNILNVTSKYQSKQIASILLSFAILGYHSERINSIIELFAPQLTLSTLGCIDWLNFVWSCAVFNRIESSDIETALNKKFISKLLYLDPKKNLSYQLKLLNMNGYAQYALTDYTGPFLSSEIVPNIVSKRSKQKELYVSALETTLTNMMPSPSYFKMNVNTNMGFLLDAELCVDSNFKPVEVNSVENTEKLIKIAIMMVDYYDICLGDTDYQGLIKLYKHLLTCKKYEVLCISYQNFGIEDKIERRITYLRHQLWKKFKKTF